MKIKPVLHQDICRFINCINNNEIVTQTRLECIYCGCVLTFLLICAVIEAVNIRLVCCDVSTSVFLYCFPHQDHDMLRSIFKQESGLVSEYMLLHSL